MGLYAAQPARRAGQLLGDGLVVAWVLGWAVVGVLVDRTVSLLAGPARETARTAERIGGWRWAEGCRWTGSCVPRDTAGGRGRN